MGAALRRARRRAVAVSSGCGRGRPGRCKGRSRSPGGEPPHGRGADAPRGPRRSRRERSAAQAAVRSRAQAATSSGAGVTPSASMSSIGCCGGRGRPVSRGGKVLQGPPRSSAQHPHPEIAGLAGRLRRLCALAGLRDGGRLGLEFLLLVVGGRRPGWHRGARPAARRAPQNPPSARALICPQNPGSRQISRTLKDGLGTATIQATMASPAHRGVERVPPLEVFLDFFSRCTRRSPPPSSFPSSSSASPSALERGVSVPTTIGLFLAGLLIWTPPEYWLHRLVFHWEPDHPLGNTSTSSCTGSTTTPTPTTAGSSCRRP